MITSINEFYFTDHYISDSDNRFKNRIKNAKLLNTNLEDTGKAEKRLKRALYYHALGSLDKMDMKQSPIGIVFGNIYFKEKGKVKPAEIEVENGRTGNVYVAVVIDSMVVTIIIVPVSASNKDIANKLTEHDDIEVKALYDITGNKLELKGNKRKPIIIDLDMSQNEFEDIYHYPILKNNKIDARTGLNEIELEEIKNQKEKPKETERLLTIIPDEYKNDVPQEKEFVIYSGMTILVPYPGGPKEKTIRELIIDETGDKRKYELEFEKTFKKMPLEIGTTFIITPKIENEQYRKLIDAFDLEMGDDISFQGAIKKFNFYKKGKGGSDRPKLGIIIKPTKYF